MSEPQQQPGLSSTLVDLGGEVKRLKRAGDDADTGVRDDLILLAAQQGASRQQLRYALGFGVHDDVSLALILDSIPGSDDPHVVAIREQSRRRDK